MRMDIRLGRVTDQVNEWPHERQPQQKYKSNVSNRTRAIRGMRFSVASERIVSLAGEAFETAEESGIDDSEAFRRTMPDPPASAKSGAVLQDQVTNHIQFVAESFVNRPEFSNSSKMYPAVSEISSLARCEDRHHGSDA